MGREEGICIFVLFAVALAEAIDAFSYMYMILIGARCTTCKGLLCPSASRNLCFVNKKAFIALKSVYCLST